MARVGFAKMAQSVPAGKNLDQNSGILVSHGPRGVMIPCQGHFRIFLSYSPIQAIAVIHDGRTLSARRGSEANCCLGEVGFVWQRTPGGTVRKRDGRDAASKILAASPFHSQWVSGFTTLDSVSVWIQWVSGFTAGGVRLNPPYTTHEESMVVVAPSRASMAPSMATSNLPLAGLASLIVTEFEEAT